MESESDTHVKRDLRNGGDLVGWVSKLRKTHAWEWISANEKRVREGSDTVWKLAELGLVEEKSSKFLAGILKENERKKICLPNTRGDQTTFGDCERTSLKAENSSEMNNYNGNSVEEFSSRERIRGCFGKGCLRSNGL
ncbi:MAG: hypothetical protein EAX87_11410 [Candidatus Thorarchaeota archaeon]|nr:hypothetical protein [Candidatus Thorarchaeota archaeon]